MEKKMENRRGGCDREMNLLLFLSFFFYMAFQLLTPGAGLAGKISTLLYMVFVPGFVFRLGWLFGSRRADPGADRKRWLLCAAGLNYACFFFLTFVYEMLRALSGKLDIPREYLPISVFTDVLSFLRVPSISALFLTLFVLLLVVRALDGQLCRLTGDRKKMVLAGVLCILGALLQMRGQMYDLVAVFFGATGQQAVPGVPYFAFFLLGIWFEEERPGFNWKVAAAFTAVSAVSLALYRTPLQPAARVAASFLPVYVLYLISELAVGVTSRFRAANAACRTVGPVFFLYSLVLFVLYKYGGGFVTGGGVARTLAVSGAVIAAIYAAAPLFSLLGRFYGALSGYLHEKARHKTALYFLLYTAVFSFLLFLVFSDYLRRGKTFIVYGDGASQYFPRVIYFSRYVRNLVSGLLSGHFELMMYDFRIGLGSEVSYSMEPLYYLFALFRENHMEFAYNFVTVLRFYLSGVTMSILCLYFGKGYFASFLASVVYVISGFPLYGASMHTNFMIPMIMLPLLILSMEEIIRKRRWYLCTIFVALSLYGNYYYLYMNTIAMGVYFLVRFFCQKEKERRTVANFFSRGLVISGSYLLGVALASIVLVTNFGVYLGSGRSGSVLIKTPSLFFYRPEWLINCFLTFITTANSPGEWMKFGFLPIALFATVLLFLRKGRKELKILMLISFVFTAFPLFGFIFSGFSTVLNRWCYMAALVVGFAVADCLPDLYRMSKKEKAVCIAVIFVYGILAFFGNYKSTGFTQVASLLLAATFAVLLVSQEDRRFLTSAAKRVLMLCLTVAVVFWQGFSLYHIEDHAEQFMNAGGSSLNLVVKTPLRAVKEIGDDSFYRCAVPRLNYYNSNAPTLLDYNSISLINSTYNGNIMEYLGKMGSLSYGPNRLLGMGNCTMLNNMASVKYYAANGTPEKTLPYGSKVVHETELDGEKIYVYENEYFLPLGYTYDETMSEEEFEQYSALERQEVLMQKMVLNEAGETDANHSDGQKAAGEADLGDDGISITSQELPITSVKESRAYLTEHALIGGSEEEVAGIREIPVEELRQDEEDKSLNLVLNFEGKPNSETYLVMENAFIEGDMSEEPIPLVLKTKDNTLNYDFFPEDYRYKTDQEDFVFNLGYHEEAITSCKIRMGKAGKIQFDSLKLYSQPMENIAQYTEGLTENILENVQTGTNRVSGTITLDRDKMLLLTIPYQNGWTAYVDGEKADLLRANYMYMALKLGPGEHTIELTFEIPGIRYAGILTGAAALLFVALLIAGRRRRKRERA